MKYLKLIVLSGLISAGLAQASDQKEDPRAAEIALRVALRKAELAAARRLQSDAKVVEEGYGAANGNMILAERWIALKKNEHLSPGELMDRCKVRKNTRKFEAVMAGGSSIGEYFRTYDRVTGVVKVLQMVDDKKVVVKTFN